MRSVGRSTNRSASKEVKNYGFKSLKELAYYAGRTTKTLQKYYRQDEEKFFDLVSRGFENKYLNTPKRKSY